MNRIWIMSGLVVASAVLGSVPAHAERTNRKGFNFGTSVRLMDADERTYNGEGSDKDSKTASHGQLVQPYVGYAFESFNLGLSFAAETAVTETTETNVVTGVTSKRSASRKSNGASVFVRFLFGKVFFFEGAGGVYRETTRRTSEITAPDGGDGTFTGVRDEDEVEGIGGGYHVAAGLELLMMNNFYFTTAYQFRMVQLRDYDGGAELGAKRSQPQKRELLFGIGYYHR